MRKNILICAMTAFALIGCVEENLDPTDKGQVPTGDGIVFSAVAAYDGEPGTKTEYGDYRLGEDGKTKVSQAINWIKDDMVEIYSPSSPNTQQKDYGVRLDATASENNHAYLVAKGSGIQWARPSKTQDFYAIYPAVSSMSNTTIKERYVSFNEGVLTGYIPVNQQHTIKRTSTGVTAAPVMDYLYMAAKNTGVTVPAEDQNPGVNLSFVPLTTTLEITIEGPTQGALAALNVISDSETPIVGQFRADLTDESTYDSAGYPTCVHVDQSTTNTYATVSLYYTDSDGVQKPLELGEGESVTLNVFLLPVEKLTNIRISLSGFNSGAKRMLLAQDGNAITLEPHKKTCVKVKAPTFGATNTWITNLPDNAYISQLSIPGSANSFSYNYSGNNPAWYRTQTVDFETQWNAGIRCFELVAPHNGGSGIGGVNLICNRTSVGVTFQNAMQQIWDKLKANPGEFAMVIVTYDSNDGHGNGQGTTTPAVQLFNSGLNIFFNNYSTQHGFQYVTYNPMLTVGEARGKIILISRITSEEDSDTVIKSLEKPVQGVRVERWGSLKDKWGTRGYKHTDGTAINVWATVANFGDYTMEYYMMSGNNAADYVPSGLPAKGKPNYIHDAVTREGTRTGGAYVQDWMRVVPETKNYLLGTTNGVSYYAYWQESFKEKCTDVWNTFMYAIDDNNGKLGDHFYINSLDGFYVDENIPNSYFPYVAGNPEGTYGNFSAGGTAGNISDYATDINEYFYNAILNFGEDNIYGPMNVVLMDMVYSDTNGQGPSSYLPSVIINNNYRFPLLTKGDPTTSTDGGATDYISGGSVWE